MLPNFKSNKIANMNQSKSYMMTTSVKDLPPNFPPSHSEMKLATLVKTLSEPNDTLKSEPNDTLTEFDLGYNSQFSPPQRHKIKEPFSFQTL